MTALEMRYRRLLRVYPAGHRADYEEEMIGVLMSGADSGRRFPSPGETADLLRAGLTARLGRAFHTQRGTGWRDAAVVTALMAAVIMAGIAVSRLVDGLAMWMWDPMQAHGVGGLLLLDPAVRTLTWLLLVTAAVLGLRRTAVVIAAAGVLVQAGTVAWWAGLAPWQSLRMAWTPVLALVILALFVFAVSGRPVRAVLGYRGSVLAVGAVALSILFHAMFWIGTVQLTVGFRLDHLLPVLVMAAAAAGTAPRVRARIAVLAAVVVAIPVAFNTLEVMAPWSAVFDLTPGIVTSGIVVLALTPVTVFTAGLVLLTAGERFTARRAGHVRAHE